MNATKNEDRWLLPPAKNEALTPGLYLVSTPIGNMRDMTIRGLDTLCGVDYILCERVSVSRKLLKFYGIDQRLHVYNDHSDVKARRTILRDIGDGQRIALISDAGTPMISDPGYKLVQACIEQGAAVTSVPGANSVLSALQLSGQPSDCFTFLGFLPSKKTARQKLLQTWGRVETTLICFESANRLEKALQDIDDIYGPRSVSVVREITKLYEQVRLGSAGALVDVYQEKGKPKGEIVIVIGPPAPPVLDESDIDAALVKALETMSTKKAAKRVADDTGRPRHELYERALSLKS